MSKSKQKVLERTLNEAVKEAMNDETFRKIKRLSYGQHGPNDITPRLGLAGNIGSIERAVDDIGKTTDMLGAVGSQQTESSPMPESTNEDLAALDRLVTYLLGQQNGNGDNWRRSRRASARGYRQLRSNMMDAGVSNTPGTNTTPL